MTRRLIIIALGGVLTLSLISCEDQHVALPAQGHWRVVNYWAVWCSPCREEIPELNQLHHETDLVVFAVNYDGNSGSIKLSVDLYQSDHGIVSVVNANPDCMPVQAGISGMAGYLVNPEYYGVHELIPMGSTRLPNLGGGDRGFVDCALTLGVYHPGAHGKIVSTS